MKQRAFRGTLRIVNPVEEIEQRCLPVSKDEPGFVKKNRSYFKTTLFACPCLLCIH